MVMMTMTIICHSMILMPSDSTNDLQSIVDWYNDQYYYDENESELTVGVRILSMCENISEDED